jgi:GDP-L-fucose synthase
MNILVTGGSGFLGWQIAQRFFDAGHVVYKPRSHQMDLMSLESICRYLQRNPQMDAIIHSAAYYGGIGINIHQPADMLYINTIMAANVWEAASRMGIKHVLSVGSACAYPGDSQGDLKESDLELGPCHSSVEGYGMTKRIHRVFQRQYRQQHGIVGAQPILTNLYGEHDDFTLYRSHVVAALIARVVDARCEKLDSIVCWGDGSPIREFMYVKDAADGIFHVFSKASEGVYNIGTGVGTSIKELVELIAEIAGYEGEIKWDSSKPNGAARKVLDTSLTREKLKFKPKTSLREGLTRTIEWYETNRNSGLDGPRIVS